MLFRALRRVLFFLPLLWTIPLWSVPLSFSQAPSGNMRDVRWESQFEAPFEVYFDSQAPHIGRYAMMALQEAYPTLSALLGACVGTQALCPRALLAPPVVPPLLSPFQKVNVILGNRASTAGFANPLTQSIEAQMIFPREDSFFAHELVHRLMYEYLEFHIGPAGRFGGLALFPTWWIEGLAEALTASLGENEINALMREMALTDFWPTWERLHALYHATGDLNTRGYVVSGTFVSWLLQRTPQKDLAVIHHAIVRNISSFPYYNPVEAWVFNTFQKSAQDLYEEFKNEQASYWENWQKKTTSLSERIVPDRTGSFTLQSISPQPVVVQGQGAVVSQLYSNPYAEQGAFIYKDFSTHQGVRLPIDTAGSAIFAYDIRKPNRVVVSEQFILGNGALGSRLKELVFEKPLFTGFEEQLNQILSEQIWSISTAKDPAVVGAMVFLDVENLLISAQIHGDNILFIFNIKSQQQHRIVTLPYPGLTSPLGMANDRCVRWIQKQDSFHTSIEQLCRPAEGSWQVENLRSQTIIPEGQWTFVEGFATPERGMSFLTLWGDKHFGFVEFSTEGELLRSGVFQNKVGGLVPWGDEANTVGLWVYDRGVYVFQPVDTTLQFPKLEPTPPWQVPIPRYTTFYENTKKQVFGFDQNDAAFLVFEDALQSPRTPGFTAHNILNKPVETIHKKNNFLFVYPYALPEIFGGPSIGLVGIPFADDLERYRIQVFAEYNFLLKAPGGSLAYVNNLLLDGLTAQVFSLPFFNGFYDEVSRNSSGQYSRVRTYNYLQQQGGSLSVLYNIKPQVASLRVTGALADLKPYTNLDPAPSFIGAQSTNLLSVKASLVLNLWDEAFYLASAVNPQASWLGWRTQMVLGGGKFNSVFGESTNAAGDESGKLNYYNVNATVTSTLSYHDHRLIINGKASTTQGPETFYLQEYYSPYQSYILGSTQSLNFVSIPLVDRGSLFDLRAGVWSYVLTGAYDFAIYRSFESLLLISYLSDWRGQISASYGGVAMTNDFKGLDSAVSLSASNRMTVDLKGFQIHPELVYSWIPESKSWSLLVQLKFMDIL